PGPPPPGRKPSPAAATPTACSPAAAPCGSRTAPGTPAPTRCCTSPTGPGSGSTPPTRSRCSGTPTSGKAACSSPTRAACWPPSPRTPPGATTPSAGRRRSPATPHGTGTAARTPPPPPGANSSNSPPPSTAWSRATCRPRSPSSRAYGSARTARWSSPARPVRVPVSRSAPSSRCSSCWRTCRIRSTPAPRTPAGRWRCSPGAGSRQGRATRCGRSPRRAAAPFSTPPSSAPRRVSDAMSTSTTTVVSDTEVPARAPWSAVVRAGQSLTITDLRGNQAVDFLAYDAHDTAVRYSAADTLQAQGSIFLTTGSVLLSNEHTPLMTVTADEVGRHDTLGGACSKESKTLRYGHHTWSQHACVENFLAEGARWGLGKRDLVSNVNWYMNVPVEADGTLGIVDGISAPGL